MKYILGEMHWKRTPWINRPKEQISQMLTDNKSNPSSWVQKSLAWNLYTFNPCILKSKQKCPKLKPLIILIPYTKHRGAGCPACALPLPTLTALFMSRLGHCAFPSGCGQAGASDSVLSPAGVEVTSLPAKSLSSVMTQTVLSTSPSCWMKYHLVEATGRNLPPSDLFSREQGLLSGIEQAAKAS